MNKSKIKLIHGDCLTAVQKMKSDSIDLIVTSPPYDDLRTYGDSLEWSEDIWKECLYQIKRVLKLGGVCVWVVNDATVDGSETGTSFKQALYAMEVGLNLHDTMIWNKGSALPLNNNRYEPSFEYMFIFSNGKPKTFNPITRNTKCAGSVFVGNTRKKDGVMVKMHGTGKLVKKTTPLKNIWNAYSVISNIERTGHPAQFPLKLAEDHIKSWSNPGDIVLDPFMGSGTTGVAARNLKRNFIGIEKNSDYFEISHKRINEYRTGKQIKEEPKSGDYGFNYTETPEE